MVLIIAEAGVNHNGSLSLAKELVDAAKNCKSDIIKFQFFKTDNLVIPSADKANYQLKQTKLNEKQYEMLKKLELSFEEEEELKDYCDKKILNFYHRDLIWIV